MVYDMEFAYILEKVQVLTKESQFMFDKVHQKCIADIILSAWKYLSMKYADLFPTFADYQEMLEKHLAKIICVSITMFYEGQTYPIISAFSNTINYMFNNELEKAYLENDDDILSFLGRYSCLKQKFLEFEFAAHSFTKDNREEGDKRKHKMKDNFRYIYKRKKFYDYLRVYKELIATYIRESILTDRQYEEFLKIIKINPIYSNKHVVSLNTMLIDSLKRIT